MKFTKIIKKKIDDVFYFMFFYMGVFSFIVSVAMFKNVSNFFFVGVYAFGVFIYSMIFASLIYNKIKMKKLDIKLDMIIERLEEM